MSKAVKVVGVPFRRLECFTMNDETVVTKVTRGRDEYPFVPFYCLKANKQYCLHEAGFEDYQIWEIQEDAGQPGNWNLIREADRQDSSLAA